MEPSAHTELHCSAIETFKNPANGLYAGIPELMRLVGIAGLYCPSSCCTERLVKEHKRIVEHRFTKGHDEQRHKEGKRDHSAEELFTNELHIPTHLFPKEEVRNLRSTT